MARIRTIKPEFWDSPATARASLHARLFYIAMWNWADDWGVGTANPKALLSFAFPNDDDVEPRMFRGLAAEIADCFGVEWYSVDGRPYFWIPSWEKHQRTEKRAKKMNPMPDSHSAPLLTCEDTSTAEVPSLNLGESATEPRIVVGRNRGTGEAGTGEQGSTTSSTGSAVGPVTSSDFATFWEIYPRKESRGTAEPAYRRALKRASEAQILAGARRYRDDPNREPKFTKIGATWLNGDGWGDDPLPDRKSTTGPVDRQGDLLKAEMERINAKTTQPPSMFQIGDGS